MFSKIDNAIRQSQKYKIIVSLFCLWFSYVVFASITNAINDNLDLYDPRLLFLLLFLLPISVFYLFYILSLMSKNIKMATFCFGFGLFILFLAFVFGNKSQNKINATENISIQPENSNINKYDKILKNHYESTMAKDKKIKELNAINEKISKSYLDECYSDCGKDDSCKIHCDIRYKYTDASSIVEP